MSIKQERPIKIIQLVINTLNDKADKKVIYDHIQVMLKQIKFNIDSFSQADIERFEDLTLYALAEYLRVNALVSDSAESTPEIVDDIDSFVEKELSNSQKTVPKTIVKKPKKDVTK